MTDFNFERKVAEASSSSVSSIKFIKAKDDNLVTNEQKYDQILDAVSNQAGIRGQLVLYDAGTNETSLVILQNSLSTLELQCTVDIDYKSMSYMFFIGDEILLCENKNYLNKQEAKHKMAEQVLEILRKDCFTLKRIRDHTDIRETDLSKTNKLSETESDFNRPGSFAHNMMLKMGWTGGGLGSKEQGRVDNVQIYENIKRQGLGNKNILREVNKILRDFSNSNKFTILTFDSSFSKSERELIHKSARRFNLKSKSEGKGDERRITVSRKLNRWDIVRELLRNGGKSSSYVLNIPEKFLYILN